MIKSLEDVEAIQSDLERVYEWLEENNMVENGKKFELLLRDVMDWDRLEVMKTSIGRRLARYRILYYWREWCQNFV